MEWYEVLGIILGSSVLVSLVNLISERLKRKDTVSDRRNNAAEQIEELRTETSEQFGQVDRRIDGVEKKIDTVANSTTLIMKSSKAQAYDRIRYLGMVYIKQGSVREDELHNLMEMHEAYQALGGDGFLDRVMEEVHKLRIKPEA